MGLQRDRRAEDNLDHHDLEDLVYVNEGCSGERTGLLLVETFDV
jgi:hypothetical protein